MSTFKLGIAFCMTLGFAAFVWAADDDGFPESAEQFPQEEAETFEDVPVEQTPDIKQQASSFLEQFIRRELDHEREHDARKRELKRRLGEILVQIRSGQGNPAGRQEFGQEIEEIEEHLGEVDTSRGGESVEPFEAPHGQGRQVMRRLEHMQAAIMHLREAGLHEMAEQVQAEAEATGGVRGPGHRRGRLGIHETVKALMEQVKDLRHEVDELREYVDALHPVESVPDVPAEAVSPE